MTGRWPHLIMGTLVSICVVLATAALSAWPAWQSVPAGDALIRLSFSVSGARNCRERTPEELAALPRNMRRPEICDRRRAPVHVAMELDGVPVLDAELPPGGFSGSGPSRIYRRFVVPAGNHDIRLSLQTDPDAPDDVFAATRQVSLVPGQNLAIDFDAGAGGFVFE